GLQLECEGDGLAPDRIGLGQMLGREAELSRLESAAREAAEGRGEQLLIVGPAGSGRTRLLQAATAIAELAGLRTVHLDRHEGLEALCRRLGILIGAGVPLEASVGQARERLFAACV